MAFHAIRHWVDETIFDLARQIRWSFLPPLMVYFAAGVSGLTSIVGTFFVKDYLELSAAFLAGLGFWAGLPWVLKLPLGHLVDLFWRWKAVMVFLGAGLIALSLGTMILLISEREMMVTILPASTWFVISVLLAPAGYVVQDVVADAITVEAVPRSHADGTPLSEAESKALHTTMQTLGRFAIISGLVSVGLVNLFLFLDVDQMSPAERVDTYAQVYRFALIIPIISVSGVLLGMVFRHRRALKMKQAGASQEAIERALFSPEETVEPDWYIFTGAAVFVVLTLGLGLSNFSYSAEFVFAGTMAVVLFLIARLTKELPPDTARSLVGTAAIIFVFRAVPGVGPGMTWFEIDVLRFDEQFLAILSLITSGLTLVGLLVLRPMMAKWPITKVIVVLTLAGGVLALPNIGLYYGIHEWTSAHTGGVVDARFIAILDTAIESPLGQVAMIPMLAWIARNAPDSLKATFFAVMASFTNLALSASNLGTKYLNQVFSVTRETETLPADYAELGMLLLTVVAIGLAAPLLAVLAIQRTSYQSSD